MPRSELHVAWKHRKRQWETQRGVTCDGSRVWKKDGDVQELNVQRELTNVFSEERPLPQKHINKIWNHLEGLWTSVSLVIVSVKTLERFFSELHTAMKGHNWIQSTFNFEDFFKFAFYAWNLPFKFISKYAAALEFCSQLGQMVEINIWLSQNKTYFIHLKEL